MRSKEKGNQIYYFNTEDPRAPYEFGTVFRGLLRRHIRSRHTVVFLCIGTDRATGDCLGPLLGYKLNTSETASYVVYGDLEHPVHAKNLHATLQHIHASYTHPFIIAVDASLGTQSHVGYFTLGEGSLKPGAGVSKDLPTVGHLFITGIVGASGLFDQMLLQTTRLQIVMQLADQIFHGIQYGLTAEDVPCDSVSVSEKQAVRL